MARSLAQLKRYRWWFGFVFLVSIAVLLASAVVSFNAPMDQAPPSPSPTERQIDFVEPIGLPLLISIASLLTSLTSFVGFFFTTAMAWRKEKRDQRHGDIDIEKKQLELEKLRLEVEQGRTKASHSDSP